MSFFFPPPRNGMGVNGGYYINPNPTMLLTDEVQLGIALEAFGYAHEKGPGWATRHLMYLTSAGISSMNDLGAGCKENTVNLDLELFGIPPSEQLSEETIQLLRSFLPGPVGLRCFRLAQKAAAKVLTGTADTEYVHRPENGKLGAEQWQVPVNDNWTLNVDCAGFVRNALKHVTKDPFVMFLSDRDFMRAKDFFAFFSTIPYTVLDPREYPETDRKTMKWRIVPDLRMVIPGDVIVYRPAGNAAGGAAFTTNDRKDIRHVLKAVKTAQLYHEQFAAYMAAQQHNQQQNQLPQNNNNNSENGTSENAAVPAATTIVPLPRNVAKDPRVQPWVQAAHAKLKQIGITSVKELREHIRLNTLQDRLQQAGLKRFKADTLQLMQECVVTTAVNTGHIVFAAGPAMHMGNQQYRIRVVHSTKFGKRDENGAYTTGVQEYYRRFSLVEQADGKKVWTRLNKAVSNNPAANANAGGPATTLPPIASPAAAAAVATVTVDEPITTLEVQHAQAVAATVTVSPSPTSTPSCYLSDDDNPNDDMMDDDDLLTMATTSLSSPSSSADLVAAAVTSPTATVSPTMTSTMTNGLNGHVRTASLPPLNEMNDELDGQTNVQVLAARMCF